MSENLRSLAQGAVERFLELLGIRLEPPVDVRDLAFRAGVSAIYVDEQMLGDGRLEQQGDDRVIVLGARAGATRNRYTIAHELGHHWLRTHDQDLLNTLAHEAEERFCNLFAATLLLPPDWIAKEGDAGPPSLERLRVLADEAEVSLVACFISLREVAAWRRSLIHWRRLEGTWHLNSLVGVSSSLRETIAMVDETAQALDVISRIPDGVAMCDLPLQIESALVTLRAEVAVRSDGAVAMMKALRAPAKPGVRPSRPSSLGLIEFALPRAEGSRPPGALSDGHGSR